MRIAYMEELIGLDAEWGWRGGKLVRVGCVGVVESEWLRSMKRRIVRQSVHARRRDGVKACGG